MWRIYHLPVIPLEDLPTWEDLWWRDGGAGMTLETLVSRLFWDPFNGYRLIVCVFYQYLVKEASFRRNPLCLLDDDEFTKEGSRRSSPVPNSQYDVAQFYSSFMIWRFDCYLLLICFILSSLKLKLLGGTVGFFELK